MGRPRKTAIVTIKTEKPKYKRKCFQELAMEYKKTQSHKAICDLYEALKFPLIQLIMKSMSHYQNDNLVDKATEFYQEFFTNRIMTTFHLYNPEKAKYSTWIYNVLFNELRHAYKEHRRMSTVTAKATECYTDDENFDYLVHTHLEQVENHFLTDENREYMDELQKVCRLVLKKEGMTERDIELYFKNLQFNGNKTTFSERHNISVPTLKSINDRATNAIKKAQKDGIFSYI